MYVCMYVGSNPLPSHLLSQLGVYPNLNFQPLARLLLRDRLDKGEGWFGLASEPDVCGLLGAGGKRVREGGREGECVSMCDG
jgi:hypothetical protein